MGCFATNAANCSGGNCSTAGNELGAVTLTQRINPSQIGGVSHTRFVMSRESRVVAT